jgi:hypothetical protein
MAERTIGHALFFYYVEGKDPATGRSLLIEQTAYRGQTVEVPRKEDLDRGERVGAFRDPDAAPVSEPAVPARAAVDMSDDELLAAIADANADETVAMAQGDPEQARRVLAAEQTQDKPRKGVVEKLSAVAEQE